VAFAAALEAIDAYFRPSPPVRTTARRTRRRRLSIRHPLRLLRRRRRYIEL
jgi:hypothetical protein